MSRCVSPLGSGLPLRRVLQTEAVCPCPRPRGHPGAAAPVLGSRPAGSLGSEPGWAGWVPMRGGTACLLGSLGPPRVNPQFLEDLHLPSQAWGGQRWKQRPALSSRPCPSSQMGGRVRVHCEPFAGAGGCCPTRGALGACMPLEQTPSVSGPAGPPAPAGDTGAGDQKAHACLAALSAHGLPWGPERKREKPRGRARRSPEAAGRAGREAVPLTSALPRGRSGPRFSRRCCCRPQPAARRGARRCRRRRRSCSGAWRTRCARWRRSSARRCGTCASGCSASSRRRRRGCRRSTARSCCACAAATSSR